MNAKKILHPTDFSHGSDAALDFASRLASESGACLLIAYVDDLAEAFIPGYGPGFGGYGYVPEPEHNRHEVRERLAEVKPTVAGVAHEHHYVVGDPADEILKLAEREQVDMIVMGSHGRTGLARVLMGSIAEAVLRRAQCPVLTVKQPAAVSEEDAT